MNLRLLFGRAGVMAALCLTSISTVAQTHSIEPKPEIRVTGGAVASGKVRPYKATWALKTNLPFWLVGGANVAFEFPIGELFSVTASTAFTRITIDNKYAMQTLQGGADFKYWFKPGTRSLTGWNAGIYGVYGGKYDIQWKSGWQGDSFVSAGVSGGYSLPIGKRLNLEFLLAVGWFYTPQARKIHTENGLLMWDETRSNVHRFAPTKAQVNLVWLIGR